MPYELTPELREFNAIFRELDDFYHTLALRLGFSDSAFNILYALGVLGEGCLQRDICQVSMVSKQTVNSSIRGLERQGLVFLRPGRGREKHVFLTPEGKRLVEERLYPVFQIEERALASLPAPERQALLRLGRSYIEALQAQAMP